MTDNLYQQEAEFALTAVRQGALLARQIRQDYGQVHVEKRDRSPVTLADFGVQALIAGRLEESFPNDPLVAEEEPDTLNEELNASKLKEYLHRYWPDIDDRQIRDWIGRGADQADSNGRFWTLDPVDGTKGYLRGGQYAVVLALIDDGQVVLGALGCPEYGEGGSLALARSGGGAWSESLEGGERSELSVSRIDRTAEARLIQSFEPSHTDQAAMDRIQSNLATMAEPLRMDSQVKYLLMASGKADLMFRLPPATDPEFRSMIWDQAAGVLLLEEAGGSVTDLDGRPLDFSAGTRLVNNRGVLASNGRLHDAALKAALKLQA